MPVAPEITTLLFEAMDTPHGLVVATNDPIALRDRLYAAMRLDPELALFTLHQSRTNPNGELIILRKPADEP